MDVTQTIAYNTKIDGSSLVWGYSLTPSLKALLTGVLAFLIRIKDMLIYRTTEIPNANTLKELEMSKKDIANGNVISFYSAKDASAYIDQIITARSG